MFLARVTCVYFKPGLSTWSPGPLTVNHSGAHVLLILLLFSQFPTTGFLPLYVYLCTCNALKLSYLLHPFFVVVVYFRFVSHMSGQHREIDVVRCVGVPNPFSVRNRSSCPFSDREDLVCLIHWFRSYVFVLSSIACGFPYLPF